MLRAGVAAVAVWVNPRRAFELQMIYEDLGFFYEHGLKIPGFPFNNMGFVTGETLNSHRWWHVVTG